MNFHWRDTVLSLEIVQSMDIKIGMVVNVIDKIDKIIYILR